MNNPAESFEAGNTGKPVKKRTGTSNPGFDYEKYVLLWVLLCLLEDPDVLEFYLADNVKGVGAFDDLVIRVKRRVPGKIEPIRQLICVQLKHRENMDKKIRWTEVAGEKKANFQLQKYYETYKEVIGFLGQFEDPILDECLEDEIMFVLYTNASFEFEEDSYDRNSFCRKLLESKNDSTVFDFDESTMNNRLWPELEKYNKQLCSEKDEIQKFLKKFIVFSNQCNKEEIKEKLTNKLRPYFPSENVSLDHALQRAVEFPEQNNSMWLSRDSGALYDITIMFQGAPVKLNDLAAVFDRPYFKEEQSINGEERESRKQQFMNKMILQHMGLNKGSPYVCVGTPLKTSEHYYVERNPLLYDMRNKDHRYELCYSCEDNKLVALFSSVPREILIPVSIEPRPLEPRPLDPKPLLFDASLLLICGGPGIGKSTYLIHQANLLKDRAPQKFVIRVHLIDFSKYLRDLDISADHKITADNFLLEISGAAPGTAEHDLFQACLRRSQMMVVFLDGVDELSSESYNKLLGIVRTIRQEYDLQLWMSTRPIVQERMEKDLGTKSWTLEKFSDTQAMNFMEKYCPIGVYTFRFIDITESLKTIPIFCRLIGSVINNGNTVNVYDMTSEIKLYDAFVDDMYNIYNQEKKKIDVSISAANRDTEILKRIAMDQHEKAALLEVFDERQLSELNWSITDDCKDFIEDISKGEEKAGLIVNIVEGQPRFFHRTVAEYFCGRWFSKNHDKYLQYVQMYKRLPPKVDFFMSCKLSEPHELFKVILLKDEKKINKCLNDFVGELNLRDPFGRDLLYYVDNLNYYNNENFNSNSFNDKKSMYNIIGKFMTEDMVQNLNSVRNTTRCLVNLNLLASFFSSLDLEDHPEHRAIMGYILTCLLCVAEYNNMLSLPLFLFNYCKNLPLHVSILDARDNTHFRTLMSKENINSKDDIGLTPLHLAVIMGKGYVAEDLCECGAQERRDNALGLYPNQLNRYGAGSFQKIIPNFGERQAPLGYDFKKYLNTLPEDKQKIFGKHIKDIVIEIINNVDFTNQVEASYKVA